MNKPLITTKVGIAVEVITDGVNGLLLENCKPETMANKINLLINNYQLFLILVLYKLYLIHHKILFLL